MRKFKFGAGALVIGLAVVAVAHAVTKSLADLEPVAEHQTSLPLARI